MTSTLIRGARVIDGSGAAWFNADVRIEGGRIAAVAPDLQTDGAALVEADGLYLAPGFIDAHCHDDLICLRERTRPEKALQGVSTVVVGNCSFSLYPGIGAAAEPLRQHFSGLLGETAPDEIFADFAAYRTALQSPGVALNLVSLVGHAALRLAVLGHDRRAADAAERVRMQAILARQLEQGAAGLSLGLVYPPSAYADEAELLALAETVRAHGKLLAAHIRNYESGLLAAMEEFIGLLRRSGAAGLLSHLQCAGRPNWGTIPKALALLEAARGEGIDIGFDMYPYPAGSSYMLQLLPPAAQEGGLDALLARLRDPVGRAALRHVVEEGDPDPHAPQSKVALIGWGSILISGTGDAALKPYEGRTMEDAAQALGMAPFDLMARFIEADAGQTAIVMFQLDEGDLHAACTHRLHMFCSDGLPRPGTRPHPRAYGAFPRAVGTLTRDKHWFALEDAVRRMTSAAAHRFRLFDRGLIRPGFAADLTLFSPDIADRATFADPVRIAHGIVGLWVNGARVVADGGVTGALPGRVLGQS